MIYLRDGVKDFRAVFQRLKAMCAPLRNIKSKTIIGRQLHTDPIAKRWRIPAQIERHVKNYAASAANHFRLLVGSRLIVHSAQSTPPNVKGTATLIQLN